MLLCCLLACLPVLPAMASSLLLDQGRQVEGLWVFPSLEQPKRFQYVPQSARVVHDDGVPAFSMTFYVNGEASDDPNDPDAIHSIVDAQGGALLHFLMEYQTSATLVSAAQDVLRRDMDDEEIQITGPLFFSKGQFSLVSSLIGGEETRNQVLLAQRPAPLMEGNRTAISAHLDPQSASLLLASLQTASPDLSVTYDLGFSGLTDAYKATMIIDWEKVSQSFGGGAGVSLYYVSLDVEAQIDRLFQDGSIKLEVNGDDQNMDKLIEIAHAKALDVMFAPVELDEVPAEEQANLLQSITGLLGGSGGALSSRNTTGFGAYASFKVKDLRSSGISRLSFNKRASVDRRAIITTNIGAFYKAYAQPEQLINIVPAIDDTFSLRKIFVSIDGALAQDVGEFVNSIEVTLTKQHPEGRETTEQLLIGNQHLNNDKPLGPMTYSNLEKQASSQWRKYDYQTSWNFEGGGHFQSSHIDAEDAMINLTAPYHRSVVNIEGNTETLSGAGVRAVIVEVGTDFFGDRKTVRRMIHIGSEALSAEPIELVLPENEYSYDYKITWIMQNRDRLIRSGVDDLGFVFIDELPE